jgi:hypothetical protein
MRSPPSIYLLPSTHPAPRRTPRPQHAHPLNVPHPAPLTPVSDLAWGARAIPPAPVHPQAAAFTTCSCPVIFNLTPLHTSSSTMPRFEAYYLDRRRGGWMDHGWIGKVKFSGTTLLAARQGSIMLFNLGNDEVDCLRLAPTFRVHIEKARGTGHQCTMGRE